MDSLRSNLSNKCLLYSVTWFFGAIQTGTWWIVTMTDCSRHMPMWARIMSFSPLVLGLLLVTLVRVVQYIVSRNTALEELQERQRLEGISMREPSSNIELYDCSDTPQQVHLRYTLSRMNVCYSLYRPLFMTTVLALAFVLWIVLELLQGSQYGLLCSWWLWGLLTCTLLVYMVVDLSLGISLRSPRSRLWRWKWNEPFRSRWCCVFSNGAYAQSVSLLAKLEGAHVSLEMDDVGLYGDEDDLPVLGEEKEEKEPTKKTEPQERSVRSTANVLAVHVPLGSSVPPPSLSSSTSSQKTRTFTASERLAAGGDLV